MVFIFPENLSRMEGRGIRLDEGIAMQIVGVTEAKAHFSQLTKDINESGEAVTVFKNNKPWVIISPASEEFAVGGSDTYDVMDEADRLLGTGSGVWFDDADKLCAALNV